MKRRAIAIMVPVMLLITAAVATAASSPSFTLTRNTYTGAAGGTSSSASYQVRGTLGQPLVETSIGTSYQVVSGIWYKASSPVELFLPLVGRDFDPSDAPDNCPGWSIQLGREYREDFDHSEDQDYYRFQATGGVTYALDVFDLEQHADTVLFIFPAGCVEPSTCHEMTDPHCDDDCVDGVVASGSCLTWQAPADGTYSVMVRNWDWTRYYGPSYNTKYTLRVEVESTSPR